MPVQTREQAQANQPDEPTSASSSNDEILATLRQLVDGQRELRERITAIETRSRPPSPSSSNQRREYSVEEPPSTTPAPPVAPPVTTSVTSVAPDNRFRPEEIGYYTGDPTKTKAFTDRLHDVARVKGPRVIQQNIVMLLQGEALGWWHTELSEAVKMSYTSSPDISPLCSALLHRFRASLSQLMEQLSRMKYTERSVTRKPAPEFVQNVLHVTNQMGWSLESGLNQAYNAFTANLRISLQKPPSNLTATTMATWMQHLRETYLLWYDLHGHGHGQHGQSPFNRPPGQPPPHHQQRLLQQAPSNSSSHRQRQGNPLEKPRVYHAGVDEVRSVDETDASPVVYFVDGTGTEWEYDNVYDAYVAQPVEDVPPGHTPRRYGNTHDDTVTKGDGWNAAGPNHRCTDCNHHHAV